MRRELPVLLSVLCFLTLALSVFSGCGGQKYPDGFPKVYPVTVSVVQDGKPLEGANVLFYAQDEVNSRWGIGGCTDAAGNAIMAVNGKYKGVPAGQYKVTVTKVVTESNQDKIPPQPDATKDPVAFETWYQKYGQGPILNKEFTLVEEQFAELAKTPLTAEVAASGSNSVKLDVGKAIRKENKVVH